MPVVEKIESLGLYNVIIDKYECDITKWNDKQTVLSTIASTLGDTKIEATWLSVVEFIKWYIANK